MRILKIKSRTCVAAALLSVFALGTRAASPSLQILPPTNNQPWIRLKALGQTGMVHTVQASTNLIHWEPMATTHDGLFDYPDPASGLFAERFYRVSATNPTVADDWKNQIHFPSDAFLSLSDGVIGQDFRWIKFAIRLQDPFRIYYQDSEKYDFHYDFATKRLDPFRGMTPAQFDNIALHTNQQQVLLGTVLFPPYPNDAEYGIQFVGLDAYSPGFIASYF